MGQPYMSYSGQMFDVEPQQVLLPPPPPGNRTTFDPRHLPENHGQLPYMMTQHNIEHCSIPFMIPTSSSRPFPVQDHVPFSNSNNFERDRNVILDGPNGGFKRNGFMGFDHGQHRHLVAPPLPWNHPHGVPYMQGHNGHQVASMSRNSAPFMHPPITHFQRHHPRPPPPPTFPPRQLALVPTLPAGIGVYEAHRRDLMRHRIFIRDLAEDELIAVGERMGNNGSGLSENCITDHLKTRMFSSFRSSHPKDHESNFCVICQMDFENEEKIGVVNCCHEYHELCIKKWLMIKNNCPICKSTAIVLARN